MRCPLCSADETRRLAVAAGAPYLRCHRCALTFLHRDHRPGRDEERARYETHENDPSDTRYRAFLDRLARPLAERLEPGMEGLDYGSGPGPTLSVMMAERGFSMRVWDPFFAPDPEVLQHRYDFVTCSEAAEHFFRPGEEFARMDALLRTPGWLGVMTQVLEDDESFREWWYVRDPTHVAFYRPETLAWIAAAHGWSLERPLPSVALFRKG